MCVRVQAGDWIPYNEHMSSYRKRRGPKDMYCKFVLQYTASVCCKKTGPKGIYCELILQSQLASVFCNSNILRAFIAIETYLEQSWHLPTGKSLALANRKEFACMCVCVCMLAIGFHPITSLTKTPQNKTSLKTTLNTHPKQTSLNAHRLYDVTF